MKTGFAKEHYFGLFGLVLLAIGTYGGLVTAPSDRYMGDVQRLMYVHVPTAWNSMLAYAFAFGFAIAAVLGKQRSKWDSVMVGCVEAGMVMNFLLLVQGSIWAKPTWGVWWDWDPRLTTSAIMFLVFAGILALRSFVEDPDRKMLWSAIATIIAFVDVPVVYMSVRWWRTLHQLQSSPETVEKAMVMPLRTNAFALLFIGIWLVARRTRIEALGHKTREVALPDRISPEGGAAR